MVESATEGSLSFLLRRNGRSSRDIACGWWRLGPWNWMKEERKRIYRFFNWNTRASFLTGIGLGFFFRSAGHWLYESRVVENSGSG
ncbi:hypothetical protein M378DRAFT_864454 [Amanita muscaria Koide BX008]|uniref:Uncharacterized protein n=1 Tax=Amanita muscaria (strain Koide BX008) TaxID=946122 RepID=A0A0C2WXU8_AMAMK|nr:hypothetical protein M378DRAFT_864454 [Amanita muscaria Koide BX008]